MCFYLFTLLLSFSPNTLMRSSLTLQPCLIFCVVICFLFQYLNVINLCYPSVSSCSCTRQFRILFAISSVHKMMSMWDSCSNLAKVGLSPLFKTASSASLIQSMDILPLISSSGAPYSTALELKSPAIKTCLWHVRFSLTSSPSSDR